jgi:CRP-like cAMP-binding protein
MARCSRRWSTSWQGIPASLQPTSQPNCIVLLSGFAFRSKVAGSGARQILSIHLRGDLVDLHNSFLNEADHSVQALTAAAVAYLPHQAILDVAASYPAVAEALWRDTLVDASVFREWILNVGRRDARQRVAHLLCELALRQEAAGLCKGPDYEWPLTQEQIGDATGLTSVHVNRTVGRMRTEGLIRINGRSITITDWPNLQRAGDFSRAYLHQVSSVAA